MAKAPTNPIQNTEAHFGYIKGKCKWAKLLEPDDYDKFSINIIPDTESLDNHRIIFDELIDKAKQEVLDAGKKVNGVADYVKEEEDGTEFLSFKLPSTNYEGNPNKIDIYNVHGKKEPDWDKLVGNGSLVKIKYMAKPYYMASTKMVGVSLRFYAVQIIDLVEYSGGDSGFEDESSDTAPFELDNNEDF